MSHFVHFQAQHHWMASWSMARRSYRWDSCIWSTMTPSRRVLCCWKYLLLIFKASQRKNYSIEAFNLLCQYFYYLSPQLAQQLLYSRFVNVHGRVGCNIPCDLHMEHFNRIVKETMQHIGANKTERAIVRSSKCSQLPTTLLSNFDMRTGLKDIPGSHVRASERNDV